MSSLNSAPGPGSSLSAAEIPSRRRVLVHSFAEPVPNCSGHPIEELQPKRLAKVHHGLQQLALFGAHQSKLKANRSRGGAEASRGAKGFRGLSRLSELVERRTKAVIDTCAIKRIPCDRPQLLYRLQVFSMRS
jgi:hypothetical protein